MVLDALDECTEIKNLIEMLVEVKRWGVPTVRILATSREEKEIKQKMNTLAFPIWLEPSRVDNGIKIFLKHELGSQGP